MTPAHQRHYPRGLSYSISWPDTLLLRVGVPTAQLYNSGQAVPFERTMPAPLQVMVLEVFTPLF